jgi:hypothetical protein
MEEYLEQPMRMSAQSLADHFIHEAEAVHPVSEWHKKWFLRLAQAAMKKLNDAVKMRDSIKKKLTPEELAAIGMKK